MLSAKLYWSFRSPYSYLATRRYREISEQYDLDLQLCPVYPLAIREPDFFERNHPNWMMYTFRDMFRVAQFHGIPFGPPNPDPIVQDPQTRKIADVEHPAYRLTRLGQAANRRGKGLAFADEVSQMIWGGVPEWDKGDHMEKAAERAGLDLAELDAEVLAETDKLDEEIAANQKALEDGGHWGVPTLVFDNEPFFGQDRIEIALWKMKQAGLEERK